MLAILFVLVFYVYTIEIEQPAVVFRGVLLGATLARAARANKERDKPLLCLKLGGAYVPLTVDFLRYSMGELNSIPDLTISLVYFGSKRKVKGKSASRSFGKAT
jgi:hypothetical protein